MLIRKGAEKLSMQILFLGTSGSVPTLKRSLPAIILQCPEEQWMFDCGENTQRQMMQLKVSFHKKMKIFISHMHGDHVLGLPGILQTMSLMDRRKSLEVYGPEGIHDFLACVQEALQFGLTFPIKIFEVAGKIKIIDETEYTVNVVKSNHVTNSLAYSFEEKPRPGKFYPKKALALGVPEGELWSKLQIGEQVKLSDGKTVKPQEVMGPQRPGRKIVYTGDTRPFESFTDFAKGADLIIHDCTFDDSLSEKASEDGHSTPSQAAEQAKAAKAKKLVLTHFSARYHDTNLLLEQAKKIFAETILAEDLLVLDLPLPSN